MTTEADGIRSDDWPERSWGLMLGGMLVGYCVYLLTDSGSSMEESRMALAAFLVTGGIALAFTIERSRIRASAIFAVAAAAVVAFTIYWNGGPETRSSWEGWRLACALTAVGIAAPLFQAWGGAGAMRRPRLADLSYPQVHDRAWTNAVLWAACWLFVGISMLLTVMLGQLFGLIGINFISDLNNESWFNMTLAGGAFGAASGLLRDREQILATLQTVVRRVLAVLGPVLGVGLLLFLVAMLFTGLAPLWDATKATTPILLLAAAVAIILANAAIGDRPEAETQVRVLRWGSMALGGALLPLGIIAAISTGLRIAQYGLTPDRLWAVIFTGIACAYGLAYLVVLARKRANWWGDVRQANLRLALGVCGLAFVLSTPLINFGAWSTASQLARLESGKVSPDKFDWAALRFDFGPSGSAAVSRLAKTGKTPAIRASAADAFNAKDRWALTRNQNTEIAADKLRSTLVVLPANIPLPDALTRKIADLGNCGEETQFCAVIYRAGADEALHIYKGCENCDPSVSPLVRKGTVWLRRGEREEAAPSAEIYAESAKAAGSFLSIKEGVQKKQIDVREVKRRQVFIGNVPVGEAFE
jgi:hypothetical protein